jgi:DNA-binding Lrp family transcriptional regulator
VDKVLTIRAILHIFVEQGKLEDVGEALAKMPKIIDVYEVTGEYDIIATVKANDLHKLRSLISEKVDEDAWSEGSNHFLSFSTPTSSTVKRSSSNGCP